MAKHELNATAAEISVAGFIAAQGEPRTGEARQIDALLRRITGLEPKLWGPSIIGYGSYDYKYASGREGTSCRAGFSPRKAALTFYDVGALSDVAAGRALLAALGKHTIGKGCLYVKRLADIDLAVLEALLALHWTTMNSRYAA